MSDVEKIIAEYFFIYTGEEHAYSRAKQVVERLRTAGYEVVKPEWEYGGALESDPQDATAHADRLAAEKSVAGWNESVRRMERSGQRNSGPAMVVHRRKAGDWATIDGT